MLLHSAHSGKTFELDCAAATRVDAVLQALAHLTGVAPAEQILICAGTRLDGARHLGAYGLPVPEGAPVEELAKKRVFLYFKPALRPGAPPPPPEALEPVRVELPAPPSVHAVGHPLDEAPSPLIRALPHYERQFKHHLQKGQAIWRASQARFEQCRRLVGEMGVQALAIDSARENVEVYFSYICKAHGEFADRYATQHLAHTELLGTFERNMELLRATELHPALRADGKRTLLDCVPEQRLRKWCADCALTHEKFASKVAEESGNFSVLQRNVEELFMTGPDVDVQKVEQDVNDSAAHIEEQATVLQSLSKDLNTVKKLVEDTVSQLSDTSPGSSSIRPLDACGALDPMNELHNTSHLPAIEAADTQLERMLAYCVECKAAMSRCVATQLQSVSRLQSMIRDVRNKQAIFKELFSKHETAFRELRVARRVPDAYNACLAEVARRHAYAKLHASRAGAMAEKMGRLREREAERRENFLKEYQRYLPADILQLMGLNAPPPTCEVSVPQLDPGLMQVSDQELVRLGIDKYLRDDNALRLPRASSEPGGGGGPAGAEAGGHEGGNGGGADGGEEQTLELENAQLRANLATHVAALCMMERGASGSASLTPPAESSIKSVDDLVSDALGAKETVCEHLKAELQGSRQQLVEYEERIRQLEERLTSASVGNAGREAALETELEAERERAAGLEAKLAAGAPEGEVSGTLSSIEAVAKAAAAGQPPEEQASESLAAAAARGDAAAAAVASAVEALAGARAEAAAGAAATVTPSQLDTIRYTSFDLSCLAAFVPNAAGNYEAVNNGCPNVFLSDESVALFKSTGTEGAQHCIVGQVVHLAENLAQGAGGVGNPYGLPPGTRYTVADVCVVHR